MEWRFQEKGIHVHVRRRTHTHAHARVKLFAAPVNAPVMLSFDCDRHMYYYLYPPLVITRSGRASGDRLGSCAKAFYHIPWGLLGSGAYRFRLSGVIPPWSRPPDTFTSPLPDPSENLGSYVGPGLDRQTPHANHPCMQQLGGDIIGREGCLETTIYSSEIPFMGTAPSATVMLYVHGSLFVAGDAWTHGAFSGEVLVQYYSVLVLGAQYRLGVFGFLALEELREETSDGSTGNYGVLDQRGLLKWIPDNARAFGGSSTNIAIWGGWADGAVSACWHFVSRASRGMLAGVIMQGTGCTWSQEWAETNKQQATSGLATGPELLRCAPSSAPASSSLRSMHGAVLARAACDLDPYLNSMVAIGSALTLNLERLAAQFDGHSKRPLCFCKISLFREGEIVPGNLYILRGLRVAPDRVWDDAAWKYVPSPDRRKLDCSGRSAVEDVTSFSSIAAFF